jgi:uncharacterized membrane protein
MKIFYIFFEKLINDTLKKRGKWSTTLLTMATAWLLVIITYLIDFFKNGLNETAFGIMVGIALGSKITNAISNKLNPDEIKIEETKIDNPDGNY